MSKEFAFVAVQLIWVTAAVVLILNGYAWFGGLFIVGCALLRIKTSERGGEPE